ncbi:phosphomethylpyrimidine synthase ThiC [Methanolobus sp. ZRKC3]|uniref:phosphomethylpyrimidine synthase ThiC n=1 Tax=Methanolobus sp. ZRKC3 TaxID=3125786 RepID=UPI00324C2CE6
MIKTQIDHAREGTLTAEMQYVAKAEGLDEELVLERVKEGSLVIMTRKECPPVAIGKGASTKINVNLGTSSACIDTDDEMEKVKVAEKCGAATITDLSMGGDISAIRRMVFENTELPITTVPIYQTIVEKGMDGATVDELMHYIKKHIDEGVSSILLHCVERKMLENLKGTGRVMGMVSKGGSFTSSFMLLNDCENPFIENFDEIMDMFRENDVVLSLGNTMRSGCVHDLKDNVQSMEIEINAMLARRANKMGVQVIINGMGGHIQANDIPASVRLYKDKADFPLFVAGPLPTDIAVGYDHIAGAIGASMASGAGADYLCYITPAEHLSLPNPEQVKEGLIAFKIAAHIGDSMKYGLSDRDLVLAQKRAEFDWTGQAEVAIDPDRTVQMCPDEGPCSMCGDYCAIKIMKGYLTGEE